MMARLTIRGTLREQACEATPANMNPDYGITLLGLACSQVGQGAPWSTDCWQYFQSLLMLPPPQLQGVLVSTQLLSHDGCCQAETKPSSVYLLG